MSEARFSAMPRYARDLVPAAGWTIFACRSAWPAISGARPMTTTGWALTVLFAGLALLFLWLAARAAWIRVEGDELTRWFGRQPWHVERRALTSVHDAARLERGTLIGFDDGALWLVPASHQGGEALGQWVIGNGIRSNVPPST